MITDYPWSQWAICSTIDPELFFPEKGSNTRAASMLAKKICADCPVKKECLEDALENERRSAGRFGVWGGTTPHERVAIEQQRWAVTQKYAV